MILASSEFIKSIQTFDYKTERFNYLIIRTDSKIGREVHEIISRQEV